MACLHCNTPQNPPCPLLLWPRQTSECYRRRQNHQHVTIYHRLTGNGRQTSHQGSRVKVQIPVTPGPPPPGDRMHTRSALEGTRPPPGRKTLSPLDRGRACYFSKHRRMGKRMARMVYAVVNEAIKPTHCHVDRRTTRQPSRRGRCQGCQNLCRGTASRWDLRMTRFP